mmetsp:Transcript_2630/g.4395  ORF Transcript_2630/g.4395 Transcript_2630/m.4395 type:complete len:148 (+) Transcript_2630:3-446(+)
MIDTLKEGGTEQEPNISVEDNKGEVHGEIQGEELAEKIQQTPAILKTSEKLNTDLKTDGMASSMGASVTTLAARHKGNITQLIIYTFMLGLGNMQSGFAISGNNQTAPVIKTKFGWTDDQAVLNNTLISSSAILGVVVGALLGGKFI